MNKMLPMLFAVTVTLGFAAGAQAGTADPKVNQKQRHQAVRIADGVHDGSLTQEETQGLRAEQRTIRQEERLYKSDGQLTAAERADLRRDLRKSSRHVHKEKHD